MAETRHTPQRIERLTPLADAVACIDRLVAPVGPRTIAAEAALGRTLAADVVAARANPAIAIALRDGFAVCADATLDASSYAPVRLPGAPAMIEVGAALPSGADAVAPPDAVEFRVDSLHAVAPLASGEGVLPVGADAAPGDVLRRASTRLRASDLAVLAALAVEQVDVREPRVCVAAAKPDHDGIIESIVDLLTGAVRTAGGVGVAGTLDHSGADALILIGGSGSGRRDSSVRELARRGHVAFHGVGLTPGETAAFGMIDQRPVLIVPGRIDAAVAVWLTLGRRMMARLCAYDFDDTGTPVVLTRKIASTLGLVELVPVMRETDGVVPLASGYLPLQSLARAEGYVVVPADSEGFPAGARVEMRPLP
jgi:molybdopterin molybdotransferase